MALSISLGTRSFSVENASNPPLNRGSGSAEDTASPSRPAKRDLLPQSTNATNPRLQAEQLALIRRLEARDRQVRAHELAHVSVGGAYVGTASFSYQRGPNGVLYAVGGEVPVDTSPVPGDPAATIAKENQVARAALAPADPSTADRRIAARANQVAAEARQELVSLLIEQRTPVAAKEPGSDNTGEATAGETASSGTDGRTSSLRLATDTRTREPGRTIDTTV